MTLQGSDAHALSAVRNLRSSIEGENLFLHKARRNEGCADA